jgi:hypothetical protein
MVMSASNWVKIERDKAPLYSDVVVLIRAIHKKHVHPIMIRKLMSKHVPITDYDGRVSARVFDAVLKASFTASDSLLP